MNQKTEPRCLTWNTFISEIEAYYNSQGCDVEFEIGADGTARFTLI